MNLLFRVPLPLRHLVLSPRARLLFGLAQFKGAIAGSKHPERAWTLPERS